VHTSTTIEIKHPTRILSPVFEFQHSAGPNLETSLMAGFQQWYDSDFITLLDAVRDEAVNCTELAVDERRITLAGCGKRPSFAKSLLNGRIPD
jgi:hypothetical protein